MRISPVSLRCVVTLVAAVLTAAAPRATVQAAVLSRAQLGVTYNPDGGIILAGSQFIQVSVCTTAEQYLDDFTITHNSSDVSGSFSISYGSQQGCAMYATASGYVTMAVGANDFATTFNTHYFDGADVYYETPYSASKSFTGRLQTAAPSLSVARHNGHNRTVGAPFHKVVAYSTPAYYSFDQARSVTVVYNSGTVGGRHTVIVDATNAAYSTPTRLDLRVKRNGTYVTFTTGSSTMSFQGHAVGQVLAAQFEDTMLVTGAHALTAEVTAHFASGGPHTATIQVLLLVQNLRASVYGAGVSIAGVSFVHAGPAGDSAAITSGTGNIQFFRRNGCTGSAYPHTCSYTSPDGEFDSLQYNIIQSQNPNLYTFRMWRRRMLDGSVQLFDFLGRLREVLDPHGNQTTIYWADTTVIDSIVDPAGKAIRFTYDGTPSRLKTITDVPGGRVTTFSVDANNNLRHIHDHVGGYAIYDADYPTGTHLMVDYTDRRGSNWRFTYDTFGTLATDSTPQITVLNDAGSTESRHIVTTYRSPEAVLLSMSGAGTSGSPFVSENDSVGVSMVTPPNQTRRVVRSDVYGNLLEVLAPAHEYAAYTRNVHGQPLTALDSTGSSSFTWSGPRLTYQSRTVGGTVTAISNTWNTTWHRITDQSDYGTQQRRFWYYGTGGRLDSTRVAGEPATRYTYDGYGRVLTETDPWGHVTTYHRQASGMWGTDSVVSGPRRTWTRLDALGRVIATHGRLGTSDSTVYDALNRVIRRIAGDTAVTQYAYGDSLHLTQVTDPLNNVHIFRKNALGWDTTVVDPRGRSATYLYNLAGQLRRETNRRGQVNEFAYDSLGRLVARALTGDSITQFEYSATRMVADNTEGADTLRMSGDTVFAISVRGSNVFTVRSRYTPSTRERKVAVWRSGGTVYETAYRSDSLGRLRAIIPPSLSADSQFFSSEGTLSRFNLHGYLTISSSYRPRHDLARRSYSTAVIDTIFGREFVHDTLGRVVEARDSLRKRLERFAYDSLGRLVSWGRYPASGACAATDTTSETGSTCSAGLPITSASWTYDLAGNRRAAGDSIEAGNRQVRAGGYQFLFDSTGNVVRKYLIADTLAFNQRYYWNSFNQLDSVRTYQSGWAKVSFGYDAWGRRVRRTTASDTTYYVWDGDNVVAEYSGSGTLLRHYTHYAGVDRPHSMYDAAAGARRYYVSDGRANVIGMVNYIGGMVATYRYTPFGDSAAEVSAGANRLRFAGRELDTETGLYYNRARYYDPEVGRFISEDPIGLAGGLNVYTFAGNDPVNSRDPSGNKCEWRERPQEPQQEQLQASSGGSGRYTLECWYESRPASFGNADWGPGGSGHSWESSFCDWVCRAKRAAAVAKHGRAGAITQCVERAFSSLQVFTATLVTGAGALLYGVGTAMEGAGLDHLLVGMQRQEMFWAQGQRSWALFQSAIARENAGTWLLKAGSRTSTAGVVIGGLAFGYLAGSLAQCTTNPDAF